jgi:hypothetical protein
MPQCTWVYDEEILNCLVDKIYKLEDLITLKADFKQLFNWDIDISMSNVSKNIVNRNMLNSNAIERLRIYYEQDFELFNYAI